MVTVHQLRGGAPDKIQAFHLPAFTKLIHRDFTNLVDMSDSEIVSLIGQGEYILPADEGDIKRANELYTNGTLLNQTNILLPQVHTIAGPRVIDYDQYVPKNSLVYEELSKGTSIKYMPYKVYSIEDFENLWLDWDKPMAFKTTTGSGSRGVVLLDPERLHLGGKYVEVLTMSMMTRFIDFAKSEKCSIMVQELIPNKKELTKVNVDFIIRDGRIISYKWDKTDPSAVFTNWNFGWFIRNKYTDSVMEEIQDLLCNKFKIKNAIMNFEAFSDLNSETYLVEFNFRWSNSTFEYQAFGIDPIHVYFDNKIVELPFGEYKFSRYWQCCLYDSVNDYVGK